ncbi:MAG: hypothetical protein ACRDOI_07225 [Trebonia sp.]
MGIETVAVGGVLLVAMLGVSQRAAVTLPPGAQVPITGVLGGYRNWQAKRVALTLWSGSAVVVYAAILVIVGMSGWSNRGFTPAVTLPVVQVVLILNYMGAVRAARSGSGGGTARR